MFLRRYTRNKDGKSHTYYALVESTRTEAGPRQHIVAYLGELNSEEQHRWQRTVVIYNRQGDSQQLRLFPDDDRVPIPDDPDVVRVRLGSIGWTNGRRFGDDVVDIGLIAILSDLRGSKPMIFTGSNNLDRVTSNDIGYNKVFPYAATPHNGRNHTHH